MGTPRADAIQRIAPTCALTEATGIVYCGFGFTNQTFAAYNIANDRWRSLAQVPTIDSYGSVLGAFNGKVFLVSGTFFLTNAVWVYDVATNTWSAGTSAPSEVWFPGYRQIGQFIYVVGGWDSNSPATNKTTTWRLDMSSAPGVWENGPIFTPGRADFGLAYDSGTDSLSRLAVTLTVVIFSSPLPRLTSYPWPTGQAGHGRRAPPNLPLPERQGNQAGFYGAGEIWSVGGLNGQTSQFLAEVLHRPNGCPGGSPTPTRPQRRLPRPHSRRRQLPPRQVRQLQQEHPLQQRQLHLPRRQPLRCHRPRHLLQRLQLHPWPNLYTNATASP